MCIVHSRTDDFSLDSGAQSFIHSVPKKGILWRSRFLNRRGWGNKIVPHIWSGQIQTPWQRGCFQPSQIRMWNNVLLYRYDMKISKKEPPLRLLISKGNFFSRTPCSFCSSKVVWIGWQMIRRQHYITAMSNSVAIVDSDFQTVSTGPPYPWDKPEYSPLPEWATVRPLWHLAHLPRARPPSFCGQHPLCLNINVHCSCSILLFGAWHAFLEPYNQKYNCALAL